MSANPSAQDPIRALIQQFAQGSNSPARVLDHCLQAIARHNPKVNAVPTLVDADALRERADATARSIARGEPVGALAAMPYVAKDIHRTAGIRTTFGSPIFAHEVPVENDPIVQRLVDAGASLIGKSNTPEFAAGSQTFNPVLGTTRNPFDPARTVGGSSGGAAAALATGMALVADGSDLAASLRNPASFCGVVGMRPSSMCVPTLRMNANAFSTLSMVGPLARSVDDLRLAYRSIFSPAPHRPIGELAKILLDETAATGRGGTRPVRAPKELRIAWSIDLGGTIPVDGRVRRTLEEAVAQLESSGVRMTQVEPDLSGADDCFQVLRGEYFVETLGDLYLRHKDRMKDTVVWNVEYGLALTAQQIAAAALVRSGIFRRFSGFIADFDAWLLPTAQVLPFPVDVPYPTAINGKALTTYIDWLASCSRVSVTGHPAISLPAGFASDGGAPLPVGVQLVGHWNLDEALMDVAETVETVLAPAIQAQRPSLEVA